MLVFTMVFHTYVAYVCFKCREDKEGEGNNKSFSLLRQARFMTPSSRQNALAKVFKSHKNLHACVVV